MLGVCYYPEQWPEAKWADDARRMAALGLKTVRIGEFAWVKMEPRPGHYEFDWLDRAIETLEAAGLGVVLGTPTATPPKWLVDQYPDILPVDPVTGLVRRFGSRRHYDFSSQTYLRESLRIVGEMVRRYGRHPAVIGWQTDNEMTCHDTALSGSVAARDAFRAWCAQRYGTIDALNTAWGNAFWSMDYGAFADIDLPVQTVCEPNPAHRLAWRRFASDQVAAYHQAQVDLLRAHADPRQFITHNFIPYLSTGVDNFDICAGTDFCSYDSYPLGIADMAMSQADAAAFKPFIRTGLPDLTALNLDQARGLSKRAFWIMEQQPGPVNWAPHNPRPAPGMVRLWTLQAYAHGAGCVSYFRWRQAPFAQEQMHAGLLRPDGTPAEGWPEIEQVARELVLLGDLSRPLARQDVALLIDIDASYASDIQPQGAGYRYERTVYAYYSALRRLSLGVDCVRPGSDLSGYKLVVAPCLAMPEDASLSALRSAGGAIVLGPRSGAKTSEFSIPDGLAPGPLRAIIPFRVQVVETLRPDCPGELHWGNGQFESGIWREVLEPLPGAEVVATYETGEAAVLRAGTAHYIGTITDDGFLTQYLESVALQAGLAPYPLPDTLRVAYRGGLGFAFNYADVPQPSPAPAAAAYVIGGSLIEPYGVSIWRAK